jgi:predicted amidohydrolase
VKLPALAATATAIQLELSAELLASPAAYKRGLDDAAERALDAPAAEPITRLVVFPELAGHLALYALAGPAAHRATTLSRALAAASVRRPLEILRGLATARRLDGRHALLAALAPDGERWWKSVMGPLARRHHAYVVAGSHLRLGIDGEVTNASCLFGPDGALVAVTDKVNLVPGVEDAVKGGLGLARGDSSAVPIVDVAFGTIATLIGYDASVTPYTEHERFVAMGRALADRGGVDVIANPAGTQVTQTPRDGLAETLATGCARFGITAHLVGRVLDLQFAGRSQIIGFAAGAGPRVLAQIEADRGGHVTAAISC